MNQAEKEIKQAIFGKDDYPPRVNFYDHPVPDAEATATSNRPRFKSVVYVVIKPTHPDLAVRDFRSRAMIESDKYEYAEQWQKYLDAKEQLKRRAPSIEAIPGMSVPAFAELKALGLFNCEQLAEHEGDLSPYNHLKKIAKRIMELSNEFRDLPEEREHLQTSPDRREQPKVSPGWAGIGNITQKESNPQKAGCFSYSFTV